jgi:hypothetical protein
MTEEIRKNQLGVVISMITTFITILVFYLTDKRNDYDNGMIILQAIIMVRCLRPQLSDNILPFLCSFGALFLCFVNYYFFAYKHSNKTWLGLTSLVCTLSMGFWILLMGIGYLYPKLVDSFSKPSNDLKNKEE